MRKREHTGFVTLLRLMSLPKMVKSEIVYSLKQSEYMESLELRVMVCLHRVYV